MLDFFGNIKKMLFCVGEGKRKFICGDCEYETSKRFNMNRHKRRKHGAPGANPALGNLLIQIM